MAKYSKASYKVPKGKRPRGSGAVSLSDQVRGYIPVKVPKKDKDGDPYIRGLKYVS